MPSESGGAPGIPEDRLAEIAIRSGKVQPSQAAEARELAAKMRGLGVERDLLGALVEKKIITSEVADDLRRQAAAAPVPDATPQTGPSVEDAEVEDAEVEDAEVEDAELILEEPPAAPPDAPLMAEAPTELPRLGKQVQVPRAEIAPCANHPGRKAFATCKHCSKPICAECIVRGERGTFCSSQCLTGWRLSSAAKARARAVGTLRSLQAGKLIIICAIVLVLGGIWWFGKHVYDGYAFSSAMARAQISETFDEDAIINLRTAVDVKPDNVEARVLLGEAYMRTGEPAQAIKQLTRALKLDDGNVGALTLLAEAHAERQDYPEAAAALSRLVEAKGGGFKANWQLGVIYLDRMDDPDKAVEALHLAVDAGSECRELRHDLGRALLAAGKPDEAHKELERAIAPVSQADKASSAREARFLRDKQKMSEVNLALANVARKRGDDEAVKVYLSAAHNASPANPAVAVRLVKFHLARDRVEEALAVADKSLNHLRGNAEFVLMLCEALEKSGANDRRLQLLRDLYARSPATPGLREILVTVEAKHGNPKSARQMLDSIPASERTQERFAPAWEGLIEDSIRRRDFEGAEETLKGLGDLTESDARFAVLWCKMRHLQGRGNEAIEHAKRATRSTPNAPTPHVVLGTVYRSLGMSREALVSVRKAIGLGAGPEALRELGMIFWDAGLPEEAAKQFVKARETTDLPRQLRHRISIDLALLSGDVTGGSTGNAGSDVERIAQKIIRPTTISTKSIARIQVATYGIARYAKITARASLMTPNTRECKRYARARGATTLPSGKRYEGMDLELKAAVEGFAEAMAAVVPGAKADVDRIRSRYTVASAKARGLFGRLAASSKAQADMATATLRCHPRKAVLATRLESILRRMDARHAVAPGPVQRAVGCDYAVAEMLAALIDVEPQGFAYRVAVERVLSHTAAADGAVKDAFAQLGVSRTACFGLLRILCWQVINETGLAGMR